MKIVFSERHRRYQPRFDIVNGKVAETASPYTNADWVHAAVERDLGGPFLEPVDHGMAPLNALHDPGYVDLLRTAWADWASIHGSEGEAIPLASVQRGMEPRIPICIDGKLSYYALDLGTPITEGTWDAIYESAQVALTAADLVSGGDRAAYALARPGGHHAGRDYYGGYCFLSTEGLAIERLRTLGADRVAYLDVDYRHCNGTQSLFYQRSDFLVVSLHCDPHYDYPYFSGYEDEHGAGAGVGATLNLPMSPGTGWSTYAGALDRAVAAVRSFKADALVVLLGVDTFHDDAISQFALTREAYPRIGERIASLGLPTVFVKGGGYCREALDRCVTDTLLGFLNG